MLNERINKMASLLKDAHKIEEFASAGVIHQVLISLGIFSPFVVQLNKLGMDVILFLV